MSNFLILNSFQYNYFLLLFILIPVSMILGPSISLINILLIDVSFLVYFIYNKNLRLLFIKKKAVLYLIALYLYLIFNSIISFDQNIGLSRNLGFIRMIVFFIVVNYLFTQKIFFTQVFKWWCLIIFVIIFDIFIESYSGKNILGYGGGHADRLVSFFKDEPIVGGFVNAFYLMLIGYLLNKYQNKEFIIFIICLIVIFSILITGERSNSIKALMAFSLFFLFYRKYTLKQKLLTFISMSIVFIIIVLNSSFLKLRFVDQLKVQLLNMDNSIYLKLQSSGYEIFKNNILFGVGNKNYRLVSCRENWKEDKTLHNKKYICSTHPHQIYFEFLSEHGIVGTLILIFIFYKLIFSNLRLLFKDNAPNYVQIGCLSYLFVTFVPLLPSGSFFNDYLLTLFFINLSVFFGSNPKTNIFFQNINSQRNNISIKGPLAQ
jgi:O-antigen ligase